ncbi:nuclease-related domain-containing protein [Naasia aerilata]|uniref:NERD domain-containing protein n=1 Tax=Naasia aerilata TaxID=1162966 RepID=A0ABN6XU13_9MICO|nr:NERD domain-containing protein [Naasia aerilata]BDZ47150.1 hypothetical protein GCM10025866_30590 [Naasia aerilata]
MTLTTGAVRHGLPGQLLIEEVVRRQARQTPRTAFQRMLGRSPISQKDLPWYTGAKGELMVGALLDRLPGQWRVLHSLPVGPASDIDHIVIGPPGVFVINTKHHRNKRVWVAGRAVLVEGHRMPYIVKAEREAARVTEALARAGVFGTQVTPLVAVVGAASLTLRERPAVPVLRAERLISWLRTQPVRLQDDVVAEFARRLSQPEVWAVLPESVPDARARFAAIESEVARARAIRHAWALIGALTVLSFGLVTAQSLLGGVALALSH